jgi:hypothetical protein
LVSALSQNAAPAALPGLLLTSTVQAALRYAAGPAAAVGVVSGHVAALTEGVVKAMMLTKLKIATAVALAVGVAGTGAGAWSYAARGAALPGGQSGSPAAAQGANQSQDEPGEVRLKKRLGNVLQSSEDQRWLNEKLAASQDSLTLLMARVEEATANLQAAKAQLELAKANAARAEDQYRQQVDQVRVLEKQLLDLKQTTDRVRGQPEANKAAIRFVPGPDSNQLRQENQALRARLEAAVAELEEIKQARKALTQQAAKMQERARVDVETVRLKQENEDLKRMMEKVMRELHDMRTEMDQLKKAVDKTNPARP